MAALLILVDYDNVDQNIRRGGPVTCAKALVQLVPASIISRHDSVIVRLYGGWRENGSLTRTAQAMIPDIRQQSPTMVNSGTQSSVSPVRLTVQLADAPIGSATPFNQSLVRGRTLRKFRADPSALSECCDIPHCAMSPFYKLGHETTCPNPACVCVLGDLFVRDEQKMVDTLLVADIAYQAFADKATDLVVVSSDTDIWPGIHLALRGGCSIFHIHPRAKGTTQHHLMQTLIPPIAPLYQQASI